MEFICEISVLPVRFSTHGFRDCTDVYYVNEIGTDFKHHIQAYHDVKC